MINKYDQILIVFKIKHNYIRHNFNLTYINELHSYSTRNRLDFFISTARNNYGQKDILCEGLRLFNLLPTSLKAITTSELFKKMLKKYVFQNFNDM